MISAHIVYQRTREKAKESISHERKPFWLRTYAALLGVMQSSVPYQKLVHSLRPWEGEASLASKDESDSRWIGLSAERPRNRLALSIRRLVTQRTWFEILILTCICAVGVATGLSVDCIFCASACRQPIL